MKQITDIEKGKTMSTPHGRRRALYTLGALGMGTGLSGCSVMSMLSPLSALTRPPEPPPTAVPSALFDVTADVEINPDLDGIPKPVLLRIYELRASAAFDRASFFDLQDKDDGQLGGDFVRRDEFLIMPGQRQTIERKGNADVRAFGLFAAFRDLEHSTWRASVDAPNSVELRRRWWGLGPTEEVKPIRYLVNLTRETITVQIEPKAEK